MKLNNKGMSLMELLVSIVLISIVLSFLFQLLIDLKAETDNNNYVYNNQVNRTDVIYTIEKDLNKYTLLGVEDASTGEDIIINFHYRKGSDGISIATLKSAKEEYNDELGTTKTKYYLRYVNYSGENFSWEMKGAELDTCGSFNYYIDNLSNSYYFKLNIYLYNGVYHDKNNKEKNNAVDDIEITFASDKNELIKTNGNYLTGNTKVNKQIGICTD